MSHLLAAIIFFSFSTTGCTMADHSMTTPFTKIVYSLKDASVPPQYHRSYTITVTKDQFHLIVDSYGETIAEATTTVPENTLEELKRYLETCQIRQKGHAPDTGVCTGGVSKSLTIYSGEETLLSGTVYQCAGRTEGNLSGDIDAFARKIQGLIPDFPKFVGYE